MSGNTRRKQKNTSKSTRVREDPCVCPLCGKNVIHKIQFSVLKEREQSITVKHHGKELLPNATLCKAHYMEAKRKHEDDKYTPKWAKRTEVDDKTSVTMSYVYPECTQNSNACKY